MKKRLKPKKKKRKKNLKDLLGYSQKKYIVNTKDHEKKRLSVTLLHDYNEEEKRKLAYDIYIMDKKNVQIGYLPFLVGLATNHKEREIKGAEVFINNDTTILSIPFIKCYKYEYGDRRGSSCYCLNLKRGKYFLYATYRDKGETYYSDTILLYVKISLANLSVKTKNDKKTIKRERTIANILFIN